MLGLNNVRSIDHIVQEKRGNALKICESQCASQTRKTGYIGEISQVRELTIVDDKRIIKNHN